MHLLINSIAPKPQDHKAKLAHTVPLKVIINISKTNILVQIACYMPESQLHLHPCNNELMNQALLEIAERLESIQVDLRNEGQSELNSHTAGKAYPNLNLSGCQCLQNPSSTPALPVFICTWGDKRT